VDDVTALASGIWKVLSTPGLQGKLAAAGPKARRGGIFGIRDHQALHSILPASHGESSLMCGIAGIMTADGSAPSESLLDTLESALVHRGRDGKGREVAPGLGLLQTRLAIIDLKTGDQPLYGPAASVLVANGEIYNYIELKREFAGERFATNSDCELPLMTYARDAAAFAKALRGMYAIALGDRAAARSVSRAIRSASSRFITRKFRTASYSLRSRRRS